MARSRLCTIVNRVSISIVILMMTFSHKLVEGKVYVMSDKHSYTKPVYEMDSTTLGDASGDRIRGYIVDAVPSDACTPVRPAPFSPTSPILNRRWILLTTNDGLCNLTTKIHHAEHADYAAIIIQNVLSNDTTADISSSGIHIFACMVGYYDGEVLRTKFAYTESSVQFYVTFIESQLYNYILFTILILLSLVTFVVGSLYCFAQLLRVFYHWIRELFFTGPYEAITRTSVQARNLPKWVLEKLPVQTWNDQDPKEICAICLEEIIANDRVRILPCSHGFHKNCIDPWLLKESRQCPFCKRRVIFSNNLLTSCASVELVQELLPRDLVSTSH